jgi:hypothetical protein
MFRTQAESEQIHAMTLALLEKKGITAENATYEQYSDAALIASEVIAAGKTSVADAVAHAALPAGLPTDERTVPLLAKFAADGRYISDLSISEKDLLDAAIAAEEAKDAAEAKRTVVVGEARDEDRIIAAEAGRACPNCGEAPLWCDC